MIIAEVQAVQHEIVKQGGGHLVAEKLLGLTRAGLQITRVGDRDVTAIIYPPQRESWAWVWTNENENFFEMVGESTASEVAEAVVTSLGLIPILDVILEPVTPVQILELPEPAPRDVERAGAGIDALGGYYEDDSES